MKSMLVTMTILALATAGAGAQAGVQESARERAQRTLDPGVFAELTQLAAEVAATGVPDEPLYTKALEGAAKRVPSDRLVPAVRDYAVRLGEARQALGTDATVPLLVAGADALQRGVTRDALESLRSERPRSPMAVLALTELIESGVPRDRAIAILREAMQQRTRDEGVLDISARVRQLIRQGVAPQDAIERVRRTLLRNRASIGPAVPPGSEPVTRDRIRNP
jgi:hypothetical protein